MNKTQVAERIKALREERHMTQNALANISGISPTYIYQLEKAEKSPTVEYLSLICNGLGISLCDFFNEDALKEDKISCLTSNQRELLNEFINSLN